MMKSELSRKPKANKSPAISGSQCPCVKSDISALHVVYFNFPGSWTPKSQVIINSWAAKLSDLSCG